MLRGIIQGGIWGLALALAIGAILSLSIPLHRSGPPTATLPLVPEGAAFDDARADLPVRLPTPIEAPVSPEGRAVTQPQGPTPEDTAALDADTRTGGETPELAAPVAPLAEAPDAAPSSDVAAPTPIAPVLPSPQAMTPEAPAGDTLALVDRETPQPPRAAPDAAITGFPSADLDDMTVTPAPDAPPATTRAPEALPPTPADPAVPPVSTAIVPADKAQDTGEESALAALDEPAGMEQPREEAGEEASDEAGADVPAEAEVSESAPIEAPSQEAMTETAPADADTAAPTAPPSASPDPAQQPTAPDTTTDAAPARPRLPTTETPAEPLTETPTEDSVARSLPGTPGIRIIDRTDPAPEAPEAPVAEPTPDPAPGDDAAPIDRFAAPFDNPEGKPILSIVMIDDGTAGITLPDSFPYPLSIAVPVSRPDAPEAMRHYRDEGHEVLALVDLPQGATPQDLSVAAQDWLARLDQVVAVMEAPAADGASALQAGRAIGEQLASILETSGHGLLLYPQGLDTTRKLASRKGVPAATIFRDLDADGQNASVIRRFLDNSAFKAGVEGSVILVTRLRPDTIEALLIWGLADRASRVALAPVSHALKAAAP
ncbi:MAG: divergent polysaccharide deacetylase family protein [Pseudomonadota bacterium]|nr:divergent polysaccharide deacetylase family protein [Pseudomonadota bacterium]